MDDRRVLRELGRLLSVAPEDVPRTLQRFKKGIEEMDKELKKSK